MLGNVGGEVDERGDVRVGMGWGWDVIFDMFFNVFNINILFTFIFVWCDSRVVICGVRWVSVGV